jgi:hypothetical protein
MKKWTGVTRLKWTVTEMTAMDGDLLLEVRHTPSGITPYFWQVSRNGIWVDCDHARTRGRAILAAERAARRATPTDGTEGRGR